VKGESVILSALMSVVGVSFLIVAVALVVVSKSSGEEITQDTDAMTATAIGLDIAPLSDLQRDAGSQEKTPGDAAVPPVDASAAADLPADAAPLDGSTPDLADSSAPSEGDKVDGGSGPVAAAPAPKLPLKVSSVPKKPPPKPKGKKPR
jgi:hypothetical protein